MLWKINQMNEVVDWDLCCGCGACAFECGLETLKLKNIESFGIRPLFNEGCDTCTKCLTICPGISSDGGCQSSPWSKISEADEELGKVLEFWEGYAIDPEIRFKGSSGGILTALSLFCLEKEAMELVLHSAMNPVIPWENVTCKSINRQDLLSRTGSRYSPASPCDRLDLIQDASRPCVFIGKPCDVDALKRLRVQHPRLDENIGLALSFFCAGTPNTNGTFNLLQSMNIDPNSIKEIRYRGDGWPGSFKIQMENEIESHEMSYEKAWSNLAKHTQFRCRICPDGLGRHSDISCGDAWYKHTDDNRKGLSLILVRTERGRDILRKARENGYIHLDKINVSAVLDSQTNLLSKRHEIFGRLFAVNILGHPTPSFSNYSLFRSWMKISIKRKLQSIFGTIKRNYKKCFPIGNCIKS